MSGFVYTVTRPGPEVYVFGSDDLAQQFAAALKDRGEDVLVEEEPVMGPDGLARLLDDLREPAAPAVMVTVCDACLTACCWHGTFCCGAINPGLTEMSIEELAALDLENPSNWVICSDCMTACGGKCQRQQSAKVASRLRYPSL